MKTSTARQPDGRYQHKGLAFDIAINRNPPVMGDNGIRFEIKDSQGSAVLGGEVLVTYYMSSMPRMAPMNYTVPAPPSAWKYGAVMDLILAGP